MNLFKRCFVKLNHKEKSILCNCSEVCIGRQKLHRGQASKYPSKVRIVEVGPRDGLQNESTVVPTDTKIQFINMLSKTGLRNIEVTSFVSPKWVPQMADCIEVYNGIEKHQYVCYSALVPNVAGFTNAMKVGVKEIAGFVSASESFSLRNTNCSIEESLIKLKDVITAADQCGIKVRGYVSCIFGCPYEGPVDPHQVTKVVKALHEMGCYEISLGDTIGVGTPGAMQRLLDTILPVVPANFLAIHCHDTYGQALPNIMVALENGISVIDSSVAGLGGCPYAKGASGNVSTEDLVYMLEGMNIETNIDLVKLLEAAAFICKSIGKSSSSKIGTALNSDTAKLFVDRYVKKN